MTPHDKLEKFIRENTDIIISALGNKFERIHPEAVRTFFSSLLSEQERGEGWISVEKKMPEVGEKVLAYFGHVDNILMAQLMNPKLSFG